MENHLQGVVSFLSWLLRNSFQASVLIVLILVAQWAMGKQLSPRVRHSLWWLVLARLMLPASVETSFSLFNWIAPGFAVAQPTVKSSVATTEQGSAPDRITEDHFFTSDPELATAGAGPGQPAVGNGLSPVAIVAGIWLAGVIGIPAFLLVSNLRLAFRVRRQRPITDTGVLDLLEDCKEIIGVRTPLSVVETPLVSCPALFGFIRPRLLLPAGFIERFSRDELRYVLLHELSHIKRCDIPFNWLATVPLVIHWFNPFVWIAHHRMRADGEVACDALALRHTEHGENRSYGRTILKLLESFSRPAVGPGMVGILENKNLMRRRISMIAQFNRTHGWPLTASALFAGLALVTLTDARSTAGAAASATATDPQAPPSIVSTTPAVGATDVDPALAEITVTFDRDMSGGFSWTGGGPDYPPGQPGKKAIWKDKRTCVLPVKLAQGKYYRVGINSTSFQNFRSANGVPARPSAIYFTTQGAPEDLKSKVVKPQVVAMVPKNGDQAVDPSLKELRVTFNVPMGEGFSWTGGGEQFPAIAQGQKPYWTEDRKTCVLPVELKPGWEYHLGINSPSHKNFQSAGGVPVEPVHYTFKTR